MVKLHNRAANGTRNGHALRTAPDFDKRRLHFSAFCGIKGATIRIRRLPPLLRQGEWGEKPRESVTVMSPAGE